MNTIRVFVIDDHGLFRAGVVAVLEPIEDIEVVGQAGGAEQALDELARLRPDIVLTDISMNGTSGLDLIEWITREYPTTRSLVLSMHTAKEYASRALLAGAAGYLVKDSTVSELERAIRAVARGEAYLSPVISGHIVADYARFSEQKSEAPDPLTSRQREVLILIAQGLTTKAIAHRLNISIKTADTHRVQLMERLDIHDIAGLVRYAIRHGLITPDE